MRLTDSGDQPITGAATVQIFASQFPTLDSTAIALGSATRAIGLKPGRGAPLTIRFHEPGGIPSGSYYLLARVTSAGRSLDSATDGQVVAAPEQMYIAQPVVSLHAQFTHTPLEPTAAGGNGPDNYAVIRVTNAGNAPAKGEIAVSWFLSKTASIDASSLLLYAPAATRINLPPRGSISFPARLRVPLDTPFGIYYLVARVNAGNGIVDSNATNDQAISAPLLVVNPGVQTLPPIWYRHHKHWHECELIPADAVDFGAIGVVSGAGGAVVVGASGSPVVSAPGNAGGAASSNGNGGFTSVGADFGPGTSSGNTGSDFTGGGNFSTGADFSTGDPSGGGVSSGDSSGGDSSGGDSGDDSGGGDF